MNAMEFCPWLPSHKPLVEFVKSLKPRDESELSCWGLFKMNKTFIEYHGYTFQKSLGEGNFGKVVKAHSTHLGRSVAIKVIDTKSVGSSYRDMFLSHEKEIIKSLKHPNVVRTHDVFESRHGTVYLVMELCPNGDISKLIAARGTLDEYFSCKLFQQMCMAVQYLHSVNVAHGDLKCENLLLDVHNNLKVCDFGLSMTLTYVDDKIVLSETFCGTSSYAAPEILKYQPYNPKVSDVWSMGVVLYKMLYGVMPFNTTNLKRMVKIQLEHNICFPNAPSVSAEAKKLIRDILHPDVEQRIKICDILQSSWLVKGNKMEESDKASTSTANTEQRALPGGKSN